MLLHNKYNLLAQAEIWTCDFDYCSVPAFDQIVMLLLYLSFNCQIYEMSLIRRLENYQIWREFVSTRTAGDTQAKRQFLNHNLLSNLPLSLVTRVRLVSAKPCTGTRRGTNLLVNTKNHKICLIAAFPTLNLLTTVN